MRIVPSRNGWRWIADGARIFARGPFAWILAVFGYWGIMLAAKLLPQVGTVIVTLLVPAFSVSFMALARETEAGRRAAPTMLFEGFRAHLPVLVLLGALYLASLVAVLALSALADGGLLAKWMIAGEPPGDDVPHDKLMLGSLVATALYTPVLAAFWFAPVLAAWEHMPPVKSLFYSFFAVWRNWRAFLVYSVSLVAVSIPVFLLFSFALTAFTKLAGGVAASPEEQMAAGLLAAAPLLLAAASVLLASFYASYRDIFPPDAPVTAGALTAP